MKQRIFYTMLISVIAMAPMLSLAHEAHGQDNLSLDHYLASPSHLAPLVLIAGTLIYMLVKILGIKK